MLSNTFGGQAGARFSGSTGKGQWAKGPIVSETELTVNKYFPRLFSSDTHFRALIVPSTTRCAGKHAKCSKLPHPQVTMYIN